MSSYREDRLERDELGELLELLGKELLHKSGVSLQFLEEFVERVWSRRGGRPSLRRQYFEHDTLVKIMSFLEPKSPDDIHDFVEIIFRIPVQYGLGKQILVKLAIGAILTSGLDFEEAERRWEGRERKIASLNVYQTPKDQLVETLLDDALFPNGYSIASFAKRFRIKLPITRDKQTLINLLVNQLFERPSDSKKIGRWGLDKKPRGQNEH